MKPTVTLVNKESKTSYQFEIKFLDLIGVTNQLTHTINFDVHQISGLTVEGPVFVKVDHDELARRLVTHHCRTKVDAKTHKHIVEALRQHLSERIQIV